MAIAHDEMLLLRRVLERKPVGRPSNPRYRRSWFEDLQLTFCGRSQYFSVEAEWREDEDGNMIVGTVYYDGKPITALPAIVDLIEQQLTEERP